MEEALLTFGHTGEAKGWGGRIGEGKAPGTAEGAAAPIGVRSNGLRLSVEGGGRIPDLCGLP